MNFVNVLCFDDLDCVIDVLEGVFVCMFVLMEIGICMVVNGLIIYIIDGVLLVGLIFGKCNVFCIIGLWVGFGEGGGYGWFLV